MTAQAPATSAVAPQKAASSNAQGGSVNQAQLDAEKLAAQLRQQKADLNASQVLFDFDDYRVKPDYTDMLQKQAQFLKAQGLDKLVLQGNSDERGGAEYNLALGQKRADAVRKALLLLGAPEDRIETISFGKEKPKASCHEESCWAENRRVDFVHNDKR
ncbi:peptidoglycan-associated lipoprotein Pal [Aquabacterium sp.]|uniref:peptidoglycan-associated lipoprotein Pal n=1 Tax=Aquabacterium sp. TaxID=1872578 RepID=UPI0025C2D885|nr:peptidoglycan-associated lipoprotein Pal [Aquabacterium sp.]